MRLATSDAHVCWATGALGKWKAKGTSERSLCGSPLLFRNKKQPSQNRTLRSQGRVHCLIDIFETNFKQEVLESDVPVLVDLWASWCGPCKLLEGTMTWLEEEYDGNLRVVKLETDKNPDIVEKYKVYGLPTIMVFRDGALVEGSKREGAITREDIVIYLDRFGIVPKTASSA